MRKDTGKRLLATQVQSLVKAAEAQSIPEYRTLFVVHGGDDFHILNPESLNSIDAQLEGQFLVTLTDGSTVQVETVLTALKHTLEPYTLDRAMLIVLPDIGKPQRLYQMLLHPNFMSPLVWDVIVLSLYTLLSAVYLYLLMLPDLTGRLSRLAIPVVDADGFSEKWAKRLAPLALLFAIGIHVITAWIFSTQGAREWWHSPAMAPDFVAVAIAVGSSVVMLAGALAYGTGRHYQEGYRILSMIIFIAICVHLFLMLNDLVIHAWYGSSETQRIIEITLGNFTGAHLFEVFAPLAGAVLLLLPAVRRSLVSITGSAAVLIAGVFAHRYLIMPAAYNNIPLTITPPGMPDVHWPMPIAAGRFFPDAGTFVDQYAYSPSLIEITILVGIAGYVVLLILLAVRHLPILARETA